MASEQKLRRVLGLPFKSPENGVSKPHGLFPANDSPTPNRAGPSAVTGPKNGSPEAVSGLTPETGAMGPETDPSASISCPICQENMVSLLQLNQHLDDAHGAQTPTRSPSSIGLKVDRPLGRISPNVDQAWIKGIMPSIDSATELVSPLRRKGIKIDLLDDNRGFSLSETALEEPSRLLGPLVLPEPVQTTLSRAHWKQPNSQSLCFQKDCGRALNVKNGIVNCRRCGNLFCNDHVRFKVRLKNGVSLPEYDASKAGVWGRCCSTCYWNKPDLSTGTQANSEDLTDPFRTIRLRVLEEKQLHHGKLQKRLIRVANLRASFYLQAANAKAAGGLVFGFLWSSDGPLTKEKVDEQEQQIAGLENWQAENAVSHCTICFNRFGFLVRKHHCRLCGRIVCEDPFNQQSVACSINVPLDQLLSKLPGLNYAPNVVANWDRLVKDPPRDRDASRFCVRCCVDCKDDLLNGWKKEQTSHNSSDSDAIFGAYDEMLVLKSNVGVLMPKYELLVGGEPAQSNRLRTRLMGVLKDLETAIDRFKSAFFLMENGCLVPVVDDQVHARLVANIHRSMVSFLQDQLLAYKAASTALKEHENRALKAVSASLDTSKEAAESVPRLTKRQVRELREQLMVMNEQKFMVQKLIHETKRNRKFDELAPLMENETELVAMIAALEAQLGDDGFSAQTPQNGP